MADFFSNIEYVMGGSADMPPQFRSLFAEYQPAVVPTASAPVVPAATPTTAPAPDRNAGAEKGFFGLPANRNTGAEKGFFGLLANRFGGTSNDVYFTPSTGSVTEGAAPAGGLYGGTVTYNPGTSAYGNIDPSAYSWDKKQGASQLAADVQRAQYQDYLNRFAPIENYAVNQLRGRQTADLGYDLARANQSVMNAGMNMAGQQERSLGRYGLQYKGPTTADRNDITGGRVSAMNQARMADEQRALNLMAGGTGNGGGQ